MPKKSTLQGLFVQYNKFILTFLYIPADSDALQKPSVCSNRSPGRTIPAYTILHDNRENRKNLPLQESHPVRRGFEIVCHDEPTRSAGWSGRSGTLSFYFSSGYNWVQNSPPATRAVSASAAAWAAKMPVYPARARPATRASAKITPCRLMDSTKAAPALPVA